MAVKAYVLTYVCVYLEIHFLMYIQVFMDDVVGTLIFHYMNRIHVFWSNHSKESLEAMSIFVFDFPFSASLSWL